MKKLFGKLLLLTVIITIMLAFIGIQFSRGIYDPFYNRLATPKASSMVIGTSRAAQGLVPHILNDELSGSCLKPSIINFAFTLGHSPYGPAYLRLIKEKLVDTVQSGVFIVAVDPWAVSNLNKQEREVFSFRENKRFVNEVKFSDINPNFEYIFKHYDGPLYKLLLPNSGKTKLHYNGWLEVNISRDSIAYERALKSKLKVYEKYLQTASISSIRLRSLEETIKVLKSHGKVYLVRMPVAKEMADLENQYSPEFDSLMKKLAYEAKVPFLNYLPESGKYKTTDGNHLQKESGTLFSKNLARDILRLETKCS